MQRKYPDTSPPVSRQGVASAHVRMETPSTANDSLAALQKPCTDDPVTLRRNPARDNCVIRQPLWGAHEKVRCHTVDMQALGIQKAQAQLPAKYASKRHGYWQLPNSGTAAACTKHKGITMCASTVCGP